MEQVVSMDGTDETADNVVRLDEFLMGEYEHWMDASIVLLSMVATYYKDHQDDCFDGECMALEDLRRGVVALLKFIDENPKKGH